MTLKVVGAGLGRTGTHSLKIALEELLGGPCYHMVEVIQDPPQAEFWLRAINGEAVDWNGFLAGYRAAVDWPASAFWRELSEANPNAIILLSTRDTDDWWRSASRTIFEISLRDTASFQGQPPMALDMPRIMLSTKFTPNWENEAEAKAAYERHNADVRASAPADRLVDWRAGDGWEPICRALGLAVPGHPFPHVNTSDEFRAMTGLDAPVA
jgi:hypothetical protein